MVKPVNLADNEQNLTWGNSAHVLIEKHYHRILKQEKKVLADQDPEPLHQMRVGMRRLRSALMTFAAVVKLPKGADAKTLAQLRRTLGQLRDLDVQIAILRHDYLPRLEKREQKHLAKVITILSKERVNAFAATESLLNSAKYLRFRKAYKNWLKTPKYTPQAEIPLLTVLPDLLSQQLAILLIHPGWQVSATDALGKRVKLLHDLRKTVKKTRYQAEFFADYYSQEFRDWLQELKMMQDLLGQVQDMEVLQGLLAQNLPKKIKLPQFNEMIDSTLKQALSRWEEIRHQYLEADFRDYLRRLILTLQLPSPQLQEKNSPLLVSPEKSLPLETETNATNLMDWEELQQDSGAASIAAIKSVITKASKQQDWNGTFRLKGKAYRKHEIGNKSKFESL